MILQAVASGFSNELEDLLQSCKPSSLNAVCKQFAVPPLGMAVLHGQLEAGEVYVLRKRSWWSPNLTCYMNCGQQCRGPLHYTAKFASQRMSESCTDP